MLFQPNTPLMIRAEALPAQQVPQPEPEAGEIAVLSIHGPLSHHYKQGFCCYDGILAAAAQLLQDPSVGTLLLDIDSPGGEVSGCFASALDLRIMAAQTGKKLVAFAHQACSAAYAWASTCNTVYADPSAMVGHIGVIQAYEDHTAKNEAAGIKVHLITSGAHKSDGNSLVKLEESAIVEGQARVDRLAGMFFETVAHNRGITAKAVASLEARVFTGEDAKDVGLVDETMTFGQCLAALSANAGTPSKTESESMTKEEMLAALKAMADGGELNKEEAISAVFGEEDKPEEKEEAAFPEEKEEAAFPEEKEEKAESDDKPAEASSLVAALQAQVAAMAAEMKNDKARERRAVLLASRPDLTKEVLKTLASAPLSTVEYAVLNFPKGPSAIKDANAVHAATPLAGSSNPGLAGAAADKLRAEMGIGVSTVSGVSRADGVVTMGLGIKGAE